MKTLKQILAEYWQREAAYYYSLSLLINAHESSKLYSRALSRLCYARARELMGVE